MFYSWVRFLSGYKAEISLVFLFRPQGIQVRSLKQKVSTWTETDLVLCRTTSWRRRTPCSTTAWWRHSSGPTLPGPGWGTLPTRSMGSRWTGWWRRWWVRTGPGTSSSGSTTPALSQTRLSTELSSTTSRTVALLTSLSWINVKYFKPKLRSEIQTFQMEMLWLSPALSTFPLVQR